MPIKSNRMMYVLDWYANLFCHPGKRLSKVLIYLRLDYTKYEVIAILQKRPSNYLFETEMPLTYIAQESTFPFG